MVVVVGESGVEEGLSTCWLTLHTGPWGVCGLVARDGGVVVCVCDHESLGCVSESRQVSGLLCRHLRLYPNHKHLTLVELIALLNQSKKQPIQSSHHASENKMISSRSRNLTTTIHFLQQNALFDTEKPYAFRYDVSEQGVSQTNMEMQPRPCVLTDIRGFESQFSLGKQGFEIMDVGNDIPYEHFFDEQLIQPYFRSLEKLLQKRLGASRVQVFRHGVSANSKGALFKGEVLVAGSLTDKYLFVTRFESDTQAFPSPQVINMSLISPHLLLM